MLFRSEKELRKRHEIKDTKENLAKMKATLKEQSRAAKEFLSEASVASIDFNGEFNDKNNMPICDSIEISRSAFEKMIAGDIDRTLKLIDELLKENNYTDADIDLILMAGNSTMIPLVQEKIQKRFGDKVKNEIDPKNCVAQGAVIFASKINGIFCDKCGTIGKLDDKLCSKCNNPFELSIEIKGQPTPFNYGILVADMDRNELKYEVLIKKGKKMPTKKEEASTEKITQTDNQRFLLIPVYGSDSDARHDENKKQGDVVAFLDKGMPAGTKVVIYLSLDKDGCFDLECYCDNKKLNTKILKGKNDQKTILEIHEMSTITDQSKHIDAATIEKVTPMIDEAIDAVEKGDDTEASKKTFEVFKIINKEIIQQIEGLIKSMSATISKYRVHFDRDKLREMEMAIDKMTQENGITEADVKTAHKFFDQRIPSEEIVNVINGKPDYDKTSFDIFIHWYLTEDVARIILAVDPIAGLIKHVVMPENRREGLALQDKLDEVIDIIDGNAPLYKNKHLFPKINSKIDQIMAILREYIDISSGGSNIDYDIFNSLSNLAGHKNNSDNNN